MRRLPDRSLFASARGAPDARLPSPPPLPAHLLLVPPALALAALAAMALGLDDRLAASFFDPATHAFPWRHGVALELVGHRLAKSGVWAIWLLLLGAAPSGHAAGGFSLIALHLAGIASGDRRLRALGLWTAVLAGSAFGLVRMAQGAHFLSHNLWAAAIDWAAATLVFVPLLAARARRRGPSGPPA